MRSMAPEAKFFQTSSDADLWQRYCGFLDLSVEEFMEIQRYLLLEQVKLMAHTPLARKIMGGSEPDSVEMYRSVVPITTYDDYVSFLGTGEQGGTANGALVDNPYFWCHSAGRGGNVKWIPYTTQAFDRIAKYGVAVAILSAAEKRGEICPVPGDKVLVNLAPRLTPLGLSWPTSWNTFLTSRFHPWTMPNPWNLVSEPNWPSSKGCLKGSTTYFR